MLTWFFFGARIPSKDRAVAPSRRRESVGRTARLLPPQNTRKRTRYCMQSSFSQPSCLVQPFEVLLRVKNLGMSSGAETSLDSLAGSRPKVCASMPVCVKSERPGECAQPPMMVAIRRGTERPAPLKQEWVSRWLLKQDSTYLPGPTQPAVEATAQQSTLCSRAPGTIAGFARTWARRLSCNSTNPFCRATDSLLFV